jgi:hypothetical protein
MLFDCYDDLNFLFSFFLLIVTSFCISIQLVLRRTLVLFCNSIQLILWFRRELYLPPEILRCTANDKLKNE